MRSNDHHILSKANVGTEWIFTLRLFFCAFMAGYRKKFSCTYLQPPRNRVVLECFVNSRNSRALFQYCFHNTISVVPVLSNINSIPPSPLSIFPLFRACHMLHPSLDCPNIYYGIKARKPHIIQFLYLIPSSLLGRVFPDHPQLMFFP